MFFKELQMDDQIEMVLALFKNDNNGGNIEWYIEDHKLFINNENNEVMIRFNNYIDETNLSKKTIEIAKIKFAQKRKGNGSRLLKILLEYGEKHGYSKLIFENVHSVEMKNFVQKHRCTKGRSFNWEMKVIV